MRHLQKAFDDAALTPRLWMDALQLLAEETGSAHGELIGVGGPEMVMFNWFTNASRLPEDELDRIDLHDPDLHHPDINYRVALGLGAPECVVFDEDDYDRALRDLKSDDYIRLVDRFGLRHGLQTNLKVDGTGLVGLATLRADRTTAEQREIFAQAVPHAATAVRVQAALDHQGARLVAGTLEAMSVAAIVLDRAGLVRAVTPSADALLSRGELFRLVEARLTAAAQRNQRLLDDALADAFRSDPRSSSHRSMAFRTGEAADEPRIIDVVTLPAREWAMQFQPRVIVAVRGAGRRTDQADLLMSALELTPAEADIVQQIAGGVSRTEIATRQQVSVATIHSHLKSIFSKTGVAREARLIAKVRDLLG